jgi:hypothetical protein
MMYNGGCRWIIWKFVCSHFLFYKIVMVDDEIWNYDHCSVWNQNFYMSCVMTILKEVDIYYVGDLFVCGSTFLLDFGIEFLS